MPSRKRYTSRFPPSRIKKIMQTDEDVGKVAAPVPLIISRALELFLEQILTQTNDIVSAKSAKTLNTTHIKAAVMRENKFDFLKDLVADIEDICLEEPSSSPSDDKTTTKKKRKRRSKGHKNDDDNPKIVVEDVNENSVDDTDSAEEQHLELDEDEEEEDDSLYHGSKDAMLPIAVNVEDGPSIKDNDSVASLPVPIATPMVSPNTLSGVLSESLHSQVTGMVEVDDDYDS